jgi:hypothetical protein
MSKDASSTPSQETAPAVPTVDAVEKKLRLIIERHPNPDITTYHLNRRLTDSRHSIAFVNDAGEIKPDRMFSSMTGDDQNVEPFAQELAEKIYQIDGVQSGGIVNTGVTIGTYEIRVGKGKAFSDIDIEEPVVAIIAEVFGLTIDEIDRSMNSERHMLAHYQELDRQEAEGSFGGGLL